MIETESIQTQDYRIRAITSLMELGEIRELWDAAKPQPDADFDYFNLTIQSLPDVISPCVLVASQNGRPITLWAGRIEATKMPLRLGYATIAKLPVRQIVFMAGGFLGDQTEQIRRNLLTFLDSFFIEQRLDLAVVEHIRVGSPLHQTVVHTLSRARLCPLREESAVWMMQVPKAWADFLKCRTKKHRYWLKRLPSVLDREFPGHWEIKTYTSPAQAREFVHAAEAVAKKTYQRGLGVGFQLNDQNLRRVELEASRNQLRGYMLWIKNEPVAFWYCFSHERTLYLAATGFDPAFGKYEPGTVLLMRILQEQCGTDVKFVNFGLGDAGYKRRLASEQILFTSLHIFSKTFRGLLLNALRTTIGFSTKLVKAVLDRLRITQRLKTVWRRKMRANIKSENCEAAD